MSLICILLLQSSHNTSNWANQTRCGSEDFTGNSSDLSDLRRGGRNFSNDCECKASDGCYQWCDSAENSLDLGYNEGLDFYLLLASDGERKCQRNLPSVTVLRRERITVSMLARRSLTSPSTAPRAAISASSKGSKTVLRTGSTLTTVALRVLEMIVSAFATDGATERVKIGVSVKPGTLTAERESTVVLITSNSRVMVETSAETTELTVETVERLMMGETWEATSEPAPLLSLLRTAGRTESTTGTESTARAESTVASTDAIVDPVNSVSTMDGMDRLRTESAISPTTGTDSRVSSTCLCE